MNLTPEEKQTGNDNYHDAVGSYYKNNDDPSRRDFLKTLIATGVASGAGLGAAYFGYAKPEKPVRIGVIGTGDEGSVLIGAMNPDYHQVVAIADIRPFNIHRAFHGDWASTAAVAARPGLISKYGWASEDQARKKVKVYDKDYHDLLNDPEIEAVVIALPLHLHAIVTIEAMKKGKHVMTEKLMAHNVAQCKVMGRAANETGLYLAVGHQRHYSILYDNAVNLIRWGVLGEIHHIRAQWHRGNLPGRDSWQQPLPGGETVFAGPDKGKEIDKIGDHLVRLQNALKREKDPTKGMMLEKQVAQWTAWNSDKELNAENYDYHAMTLPNGRPRSAMEELCRWRLWQRTGGGLMAELGSHQLDAASIFISALRKDGKKAHPLSVHAVGGRHTFPMDREAEDHVYCTFEFPGPGYEPGFDPGYKDTISGEPITKDGIPSYDVDPNKRIIVTYSSIMGNGFGGYGEIVMGSKGTLILEREKEVMLFKDSSTATRVGVKKDAAGPSMDTQASGDTAAVAKAASTGPVSRGYTEELEHWAWCIRNQSPENQPRCRPEVALGDAVIALSANVAIRNSMAGKGGYVQFEDGWYNINDDATPDGSSVADEMKSLGA